VRRSPRVLTFNVPACTPQAKTPARQRERSGEAGGLVRLVEHINSKNQDVKSRRVAGPIEKIPHFRKGNAIYF